MKRKERVGLTNFSDMSSLIPRRDQATGIVIFSGGSAANSLVDVFGIVAENRNAPLTYVIPISDNGGSSSELIRVFGGPGIGDLRSSTSPSSLQMVLCEANVSPP